jgi:hypothetical protein
MFNKYMNVGSTGWYKKGETLDLGIRTEENVVAKTNFFIVVFSLHYISTQNILVSTLYDYGALSGMGTRISKVRYLQTDI